MEANNDMEDNNNMSHSFSDNSDLDPDFVIDCEMVDCSKKSVGKCGCGYWMCKMHLHQSSTCDLHECFDDDYGRAVTLKKKKSIEIVKPKKKLRVLEEVGNIIGVQEKFENKAITNEIEEYKEQFCEYVNCKGEVWAACHKCNALLCWTHFDMDVLDCVHHKSFSDATKHTQFEIEGSPREFERKKKISSHFMKVIAKKRKLSGKDYIVPSTMNLVPPKSLKPVCQSNYCKKFGKQCHIFTEEERDKIMNAFYETENLQQQREYINRYVTKSNPKHQKQDSRKKNRLDYCLPFFGEKVPVCKVFFLNTLVISEKFMRTAVGKLEPTGIVQRERRGGRPKGQLQRDEKIRKNIREHISLFPRVESHYCRKSTTKEYLHSDLSIPKMYSMYLKENEGETVGGIDFYRKIVKEMNLSFHRPKKDLCSLCTTFREGDEEVKNNLKEKFEKHQYEKEQSRIIKKESKEKAIAGNNTLVSAVFDLQQVIHLPISKESAVFYKQRFSHYNFTVYNLATRDCHCYTWTELDSKRGSSEIATCVFKFLQQCDTDGVESVDLFSDGCQGQNKNTILPSMFLYFLKTSKNIKTVTHYFFESFHGQNEGDSVHSTIGAAISRAGNIYVPSQIPPIIRLARKKHPYIVHEMQFSDFLDFKSYSQNLRLLSARRAIMADDKVNDLNWTKMLIIRVDKENLNKILFKVSYSEQQYQTIELPRKVDLANINVLPLNKTQQKISKKKYLSLRSLCEGLQPVIRLKNYQDFYKNLPYA